MNEQLAAKLEGALRAGTSRDDLLRLLNGGELQRTFAQLLGNYGFSNNDLADVFTGVSVIGWQIANDRSDIEEKLGYQKIRANFAQTLADADWVKKLDDASKQTVADGASTGMMLILARYQNAKTTRNAQETAQAGRDAQALLVELLNQDPKAYHLTAQGFVPKNASAAQTSPQSVPKKPLEAASKPAPQLAAPPAKPSNGGAKLERVALLVDYESGYGGAIYPVHNPYVFFSNGTVVKEPKRALDELNHGARSRDDGRWGQWQQVGNKVKITWDQRDRKGKVDTSEKDWPGPSGVPAATNEKLNGTWSTIGGGGNLALGGSTGVVTSGRFTFSPDGRFTTERMAGGSTTTETGSNSSYASRNGAGTYQLDGYTLNLKFNNGERKRVFFCYLDKSKSSFRIGGSNYTPSK